jgi:hypothetical protein
VLVVTLIISGSGFTDLLALNLNLSDPGLAPTSDVVRHVDELKNILL